MVVEVVEVVEMMEEVVDMMEEVGAVVVVVVRGAPLVVVVVTWLMVTVVDDVEDDDVDDDRSVLLFMVSGMLMSPLQRLEVQVQAYDEVSTGWGLQVSAGNMGAVMSPSRTEPGWKHSLTTKVLAHL